MSITSTVCSLNWRRSQDSPQERAIPFLSLSINWDWRVPPTPDADDDDDPYEDNDDDDDPYEDTRSSFLKKPEDVLRAGDDEDDEEDDDEEEETEVDEDDVETEIIVEEEEEEEGVEEVITETAEVEKWAEVVEDMELRVEREEEEEEEEKGREAGGGGLPRPVSMYSVCGEAFTVTSPVSMSASTCHLHRSLINGFVVPAI
jgi:hypothetical protein